MLIFVRSWVIVFNNLSPIVEYSLCHLNELQEIIALIKTIRFGIHLMNAMTLSVCWVETFLLKGVDEVIYVSMVKIMTVPFQLSIVLAQEKTMSGKSNGEAKHFVSLIWFSVCSDFNFEHLFTDGNCYPVMGLEVDTSVPHSCSTGSKTYTVSRGYV